MKISEMIQRASSGAHTGVDSSAETTALLSNAMADIIRDIIVATQDTPVQQLTPVCKKYGVGLVFHAGKLEVIFE